MTAEWYYIGHYGQLGPLTREQVDELVEGGVIERATWIWRPGMSDWVPAESVSDLASSFKKSDPYLAPPPSPVGPPGAIRSTTAQPPSGFPQPDFNPLATRAYAPVEFRSRRSRILGGILNFLIPGVGRIYLGYTAIGVLQLVTVLCGGIGILWSWVDAVVILAGGVRLDGFGHRLDD